MRIFEVGVDESGRSFMAKQSDVSPSPIPGLPGSVAANLFSLTQSPPPPCKPGAGKSTGGMPAGHFSWYVIEHQPRAPGEESAATELHHRNAIDLVAILEGGGEMLLHDGAHPVQAGDCIIMAGTDHGLRPGAQGCRLMAFAIGAQPA